MRVLLVLLFVLLAIIALAVLAYRYVVGQRVLKQRELDDVRRGRTPADRYRAGEISAAEFEQELDRELRRARDEGDSPA